jgi:hypothetical protein
LPPFLPHHIFASSPPLIIHSNNTYFFSRRHKYLPLFPVLAFR